MTSREQGRFLIITFDYKTGSHTIHNMPSASYSDCISICQRMRPTEESKCRLLLRAHMTTKEQNDNPNHPGNNHCRADRLR